MPENNQNQNQAKITNGVRLKSDPLLFWNPWRIFGIEAFLFSLTLLLGIASAFRINETLETEKITPPQVSLWVFIFYFLLTTLFILLIIHFLKFKKEKGLLFKILFISAIFFGGLLCLEAWLVEPLPLITIFFLIFWWWRQPSVFNQDILIILGIAGVGGTLGLRFLPEIVIPLLIIFSIYDFIAVYKTKHMVKIVKEMIESKAILALVIPQNIFGFKSGLEEIKPGGKFLILGGGDIVFPLFFCSSLISQGILNSLIVAFFALFGLFVGFYFFISQKVRQPIPALPTIALFSIIGFLITKLI